MTHHKLQWILKNIVYEENVTSWRWENYKYVIYQSEDIFKIDRVSIRGKLLKTLTLNECVEALKYYRIIKMKNMGDNICETQ